MFQGTAYKFCSLLLTTLYFALFCLESSIDKDSYILKDFFIISFWRNFIEKEMLGRSHFLKITLNSIVLAASNKKPKINKTSLSFVLTG